MGNHQAVTRSFSANKRLVLTKPSSRHRQPKAQFFKFDKTCSTVEARRRLQLLKQKDLKTQTYETNGWKEEDICCNQDDTTRKCEKAQIKSPLRRQTRQHATL